MPELESESEYETKVEYLMLEMRPANCETFDIHKYQKCRLKGFIHNIEHPSIELLLDGEWEEYEGQIVPCIGSHLFFRHYLNSEEIDEEKHVQLEYIAKSDRKCVIAHFKPKL